MTAQSLEIMCLRELFAIWVLLTFICDLCLCELISAFFHENLRKNVLIKMIAMLWMHFGLPSVAQCCKEQTFRPRPRPQLTALKKKLTQGVISGKF